MSSELCEMALQQTKELIRITNDVLNEMCCRRFTGHDLYAHAMSKVLGGKGRRGPKSIFVMFLDGDQQNFTGHVYHLHNGEALESSEEIIIDRNSRYVITLGETGTIVCNWRDSCSSVNDFQEFVHPAVRHAIGRAIQNFIFSGLGTDYSGMLIAVDYPGEATDYDAEVLNSLGLLIVSILSLSSEVRETENAFRYTIGALARACEAAEEGTGQHVLRVNRYAGALAANMGLPADTVLSLYHSAQMHDVGKIKVPTSILLKEGTLDRQEEAIMRLHPVYGEKILGDSPRLQVARDLAIAHHENWDGSGYPYGLKGEQIPLPGRIVKIADIYDALRSRRSYKPAFSHPEALEIFRKGDVRVNPKKDFDPEALATFFKIEQRFAEIYESLRDSGLSSDK